MRKIFFLIALLCQCVLFVAGICAASGLAIPLFSLEKEFCKEVFLLLLVEMFAMVFILGISVSVFDLLYEGQIKFAAVFASVGLGFLVAILVRATVISAFLPMRYLFSGGVAAIIMCGMLPYLYERGKQFSRL